jgi:hypothetical protein
MTSLTCIILVSSSSTSAGSPVITRLAHDWGLTSSCSDRIRTFSTTENFLFSPGGKTCRQGVDPGMLRRRSLYAAPSHFLLSGVHEMSNCSDRIRTIKTGSN